MLRQDAGRLMLGTYFSNKKIPEIPNVSFVFRSQSIIRVLKCFLRPLGSKGDNWGW